MSKKNIVILGNGFDLSMRLPTKYVDFVNSKYWPIKEPDSCHFGENNLYNFIHKFIQDNRDSLGNVRWIDLEELIRQYALSKSSESITFESEKDIVAYDKDIFEQIKSKFIQYVVDVVHHKSDSFSMHHSIAGRVVKEVAKNGTFSKVYSFNYTKTESMLDFVAEWNPEVIHIHGKAFTYSNEIILGVGNSKGIRKDYRFFLKPYQTGYDSHDLNEDLFNADQIIFFGLSFGESDFVYFKRFFEETINNHNSQKKKKIVHIFTLDSASKAYILDAFEDAGLSAAELFSRLDIRFYTEKEFDLSINGVDPFEKFKKTLADTLPKSPAIVTAEVNKFIDTHPETFGF